MQVNLKNFILKKFYHTKNFALIFGIIIEYVTICQKILKQSDSHSYSSNIVKC